MIIFRSALIFACHPPLIATDFTASYEYLAVEVLEGSNYTSLPSTVHPTGLI